MQLGQHFGKRKSQWNMFHDHTRLYFHRLENTNIKSALILSSVQFLILLPLLYWTLENYNLFEQFIPLKTHLKENIISEKKWILFLFGISYVFSVFLNYQFIRFLIRNNDSNAVQNLNASKSNDHIFSFDEAAARRRAS